MQSKVAVPPAGGWQVPNGAGVGPQTGLVSGSFPSCPTPRSRWHSHARPIPTRACQKRELLHGRSALSAGIRNRSREALQLHCDSSLGHSSYSCRALPGVGQPAHRSADGLHGTGGMCPGPAGAHGAGPAFVGTADPEESHPASRAASTAGGGAGRFTFTQRKGKSCAAPCCRHHESGYSFPQIKIGT